MRCWKWGLGVAVVLISTLSWSGCSDENGEDGEGESIQCPPGQVPIGGECRQVGTPNNDGNNDINNDQNNDVNNDQNNDVNNDQNNDVNNDQNNDVNNDMPCIQGQRRCIDTLNIERCDAQSNWIAEPCAEGTLCEDGSCRPPSCEPGTILGCLSMTELAICNETGTGPRGELCPDNLGGRNGECTDQICDEGQTRCLSPEQLQICNAEGTGFVPGEMCPAGTQCDGGTCRSLCELNAKVTSYLGCDYWSVDLDNVETGQTQSHAIVVSNPNADLSAEITITRTDGTVLSFPNSTVAPRGQEVYLIPTGNDIDGSGVWSGRAWRVDASIPVTVHQFNPLNGGNVFTNDASLLLPSNATDTDYIVMAWRHRGNGFGTNLSGFLTVVAVEEGDTQVTVTPTAAIAAGMGVPQLSPNTPHTVTLSQGQVLSMSTSGPEGSDLTGSVISASKRVAVFGGHECANIPNATTNYCDHLEQQIFPLSSWGNRYMAVPFKPRNGSQQDTWVVVSGADGVTINTNPPQAINGLSMSRGQKVEFNSNQAFEISASGPILVGQFMHGSNYLGFTASQTCGGVFSQTGIGDPAFTLAVPVEQYRDNYIVLTPADYVEDYLNIVAPNGAQITIDGQPVAGLTPLGNTGFSTVQLTVADGVHRLESAQPFGLVSYGYNCDVSYAYPGGLNLENLR